MSGRRLSSSQKEAIAHWALRQLRYDSELTAEEELGRIAQMPKPLPATSFFWRDK